MESGAEEHYFDNDSGDSLEFEKKLEESYQVGAGVT